MSNVFEIEMLSNGTENRPEPPNFNTTLAGAYNRVDRVVISGRVRKQKLVRWSVSWAFTVLLTAGVLALTLWPQSQGWATTDGYVLYYKVDYPNYIGVTSTYRTPGPPRNLKQAVDNWADQNSHKAPDKYKGRLAYVSHNTSTNYPQLVNNGEFEVTLISGNSELLASLINATSGIAHVAHDKVISKQFHFNQEIPEVFDSNHKVTINGEEYKLPDDFAADEANMLFRSIRSWSSTAGNRGYYTNYKLAEVDRFDFGTLVLIELDEDKNVVYTTLRRDPLFPDIIASNTDLVAENGLVGYLGAWDQDGDMDEQQAIYELRWSMERLVNERNPEKAADYVTDTATEIVIPLLSPQRWEDAINGTAPSALMDEERASTKQMYSKLEDVFLDWVTTHPEYIDLSGLKRFGVCSVGSYISDYDKEKTWQEQDHYIFALECLVYLPGEKYTQDLLSAFDSVGLVHEPLVYEKFLGLKLKRTYWPDGNPE